MFGKWSLKAKHCQRVSEWKKNQRGGREDMNLRFSSPSWGLVLFEINPHFEAHRHWAGILLNKWGHKVKKYIYLPETYKRIHKSQP